MRLLLWRYSIRVDGIIRFHDFKRHQHKLSSNQPLKIFITYSQENMVEKDKLITQLAGLKDDGLITIWHDEDILSGNKWRDDTFSNLEDSDLLLYLTSSHSLVSDNCNEEFEAALDAGIRIIPIILEHCNWSSHPLSDFQVLPAGCKPITNWENEDDGWRNVFEGIQKVVEKESRVQLMSKLLLITVELYLRMSSPFIITIEMIRIITEMIVKLMINKTNQR